jgi:single-stranded-DNA-specific exonuclease
MSNKFLEKLKELELSEVLEIPSFNYEGFTNDERLFNAISQIIDMNLRVLIHGDSDPDGAFGSKILIETFNRLGYTNYEFYEYKIRTHSITNEAVNYAIYGRYDYIFIIDSSTNDLPNINKLCNFGVNVVVLDHHFPNYTLEVYPENCILINTMMENIIRRKDMYTLSCGALVFVLCSKYLMDRNMPYKQLSAYALITLYSDSIDMTKDLNRSIYYMAMSLDKSELPREVNHYLKDYNTFSRRFIEFSFVPKINSLFRAEELELLNRYMFRKSNYEETRNILERINNIHEEKRSLISTVTDIVVRENLDNIVIANLGSCNVSISMNKLYNYTGLVANNLSQEYGKPCVVLCDTGKGIKGSFRDNMSRNYLKVFKQFCKSDGHPSAFGISLSYKDYHEFIYYLKEKIDKKFYILGVQEPIIIEHDESMPDISLVEHIATYNEFSGINAPIAIITKKNNLVCSKNYSKSYNYKYKWGTHSVESNSLLISGSRIKIKPVKSSSIRLIAMNSCVSL